MVGKRDDPVISFPGVQVGICEFRICLNPVFRGDYSRVLFRSNLWYVAAFGCNRLLLNPDQAHVYGN